MSEESRKRIADAKRGAKNPMWVGESVGYRALHAWVKRNTTKPSKCDECGEQKPLDLANKGTYDRNLENWEWLCRKCHMTKDGRLKVRVEWSMANKGKHFIDQKACKCCGEGFYPERPSVMFCSYSCSSKWKYAHGILKLKHCGARVYDQ